MKIYQREKGKYQDISQFHSRSLYFLYNTKLGRRILKYITLPIFSKVIAVYYNSSLSKRKIKPFIQKYHINMEEYEKREYYSFQDFFIRKLCIKTRNICTDRNRFISPADAKLMVYPISEDLLLNIKGISYPLETLLDTLKLAKDFRGGMALVFRLGVEDYHRYAFIESGKILYQKRIQGRLHTVRSFSRKYPIFIQNTREYIIVQNKRLGKYIQMEVGAILVGGIQNHKYSKAYRGKEKGFFHFGASTIIVLLERGKVHIDRDILWHSQRGIETTVKYLEGIGDIIC